MRSKNAILTVGIAAITFAGACTPLNRLAPGCRVSDRDKDSTEPPIHCLFFPSGLAMDPLGDLLYVANSNADLSFGGGTLTLVDPVRHELAVSCFREPKKNKGCLHDTKEELTRFCQGVLTEIPAGTSLESIASYERSSVQSGKVSHPSDLDPCFCSVDLLDPSIVNCDSDRFVLRRHTLKTGNFSGQIAILHEDPANWQAQVQTACLNEGTGQPGDDSCQVLRRTLYLPVRGDPSITTVSVARAPTPKRRKFVSKNPNLDEVAPDLDLSFREICDTDDDVGRVCDRTFRVQRSPDRVLVDPKDPNQGTKPHFIVPAEPFDLTVDRGCLLPGFAHRRGDGTFCRNTKTGEIRDDLYYQYLVSTHLSEADVSAYKISGHPSTPDLPRLSDVRSGLYSFDQQGRRGVFAVAPRIPGDPSQPWYLTSRSSGQISTFRLLNPEGGSKVGPQVVPGLFFSIASSFTTGQDVRDLIFEPGGQRAFLTVQTPPSLAVLDTRIDPLSGGLGVPFNQVTGIVDLCPTPARMVLSRVPRIRQGQPAELQSLLYVSCYGVGRLAIVDPDRVELIDTVEVGRGPVSMVFNHGEMTAASPGIEPCADPYVSSAEAARRGVVCPGDALRVKAGTSELPPRGYVSLYLDNAVAVVDLDPRSVTFRRVVSRIGNPSPKQVQ